MHSDKAPFDQLIGAAEQGQLESNAKRFEESALAVS